MKTIEDSILTISHAKFSAKILLQGAQIIEFTPKDGKNIFWHVNMEHFHMQKPFRGGVPICWPWFGKSASPSHGFARISEWTLAAYSESEEGVYIQFTLNDSEATRALWNHAFGLRLEMRLGERCDLMLHIDADVPTTGALHSYFAVESIEECSIEGLGESYYDSLNDSKLTKEESRHVKITAETDRIYNRPDSLNTINRGTRERIVIKHHGASDVVLWNPWYEGAEAFWDMESADASKMLCVESARINKPFEPRSSLGVSIESVKRAQVISETRLDNSIFSIPFWRSLLFIQNKWHQHGVLLHTLRVLWYVLKHREPRFIAAALLHDIGKPFVAFVKDEEDALHGEYSFTDHEERSYQIIKNWPFISEYTKQIVRYHYLIRDIKKSKSEDHERYVMKERIWESLDDEMHHDLQRFLRYDDLGKGKKRR